MFDRFQNLPLTGIKFYPCLGKFLYPYTVSPSGIRISTWRLHSLARCIAGKDTNTKRFHRGVRGNIPCIPYFEAPGCPIRGERKDGKVGDRFFLLDSGAVGLIASPRFLHKHGLKKGNFFRRLTARRFTMFTDFAVYGDGNHGDAVRRTGPACTRKNLSPTVIQFRNSGELPVEKS